MKDLAIKLIQNDITNVHYKGLSIVIYFWDGRGHEHWYCIENHDIQGFDVYDSEEVLLLQAV